MLDAGTVLQETIAAVSEPGVTYRQYNGIVRKASIKVQRAVGQQIQAQKNKGGAPPRFNRKLAETICDRISQGETLKEICEDLKLSFPLVLKWVDQHPWFGDNYRRARKDMALSLVENLVSGVRTLENDRALAARVQADVYRWVAQRFDPERFSDVKRVELSGEVNHRHVHELATEQKQRIAESWLMSQQAEDTPGITAETTGPDIKALESDGVREICEGEQRELPKRKRTASQKPPTSKAKPGRKPKLNLDQPVDQPS